MHVHGLAQRAVLAAVAIAAASAVAAPATAAPRARATTTAAAAAALAGHAVPVQCVSVPAFNAAAYEAPDQLWAYGIAGLYNSNTKEIVLTNAVCAGLATIPTLGARPLSQSAALAVFTLAHEIGHSLYGPDEATADRYGLAHASALAYLLGLRTRQDYWMLADWIRNYAPLHAGVQP